MAKDVRDVKDRKDLGAICVTALPSKTPRKTGPDTAIVVSGPEWVCGRRNTAIRYGSVFT